MAILERTSKRETLADLLQSLGSISPDRILASPPPGGATEKDLLSPRLDGRLYELVDGVLVEKAMGYLESILAGVLIQMLREYLDENPLGVVLAPDGGLILAPGLVRLPDVSFISWGRFPNGELPPEAFPAVAPDLAIEVLSAGNTRAELERKLREYFAAGTQLVWYVDRRLRTVHVYTSKDEVRMLGESDTLDGGAVLPGFTLAVAELFSRAERGMPVRQTVAPG